MADSDRVSLISGALFKTDYDSIAQAHTLRVNSLPSSTIALASTIDASISSSTEITLNPATIFIRIYAKTQDVYFKWGTDDVTSSNSDGIIPAGQIVDLYTPANVTAINFIEQAASASITVHEY